MPRIERSIWINAPIEKAFNYVRKPANQLQWLPAAIEADPISADGGRERWTWTQKMMGQRLTGESECTSCIPNESLILKYTGNAESTWTFSFAQEASGTRVGFVVDYEIPAPIALQFAEPLVKRQNEREADLAVSNLKNILENG